MAQASVSKPISVSYSNLLQCFPELADESLSTKVDLNRLREGIDEKFVTSKSQLRQRQIYFSDADDQSKRLTLRARNPGDLKVDYSLTLEKIDDKGGFNDVKLPDVHRINPKQEVLNNILVGASIKSDRYTYHDTKLNGVFATYTRNFKEVEELELVDKNQKRSVSCEKKVDLGIICTCSKK